jgi:hypothetical protein
MRSACEEARVVLFQYTKFLLNFFFFNEILDNTEVNISQLSFSNIVVMNIHLYAFFLPSFLCTRFT